MGAFMHKYEFDTTAGSGLSGAHPGQCRRDHARHRLAVVGDALLPATRTRLATVVHRDLGRHGLAIVPDNVRAHRGRPLLHQHLGVPPARRPDPGTSPDDIDRTLFAAGGIKLDPYELPDEPDYMARARTYRRRQLPSFLERPPLDRLAAEHAAAQDRRRTGGRIVSHEAQRRAARSDHVAHSLGRERLRDVSSSARRSARWRSVRSKQVWSRSIGDEGYELGRQVGDGHRRYRVR